MLDRLHKFYIVLTGFLKTHQQEHDMQDKHVNDLTKQLKAMTAERDILLAEQEEAIQFIELMAIDLDKR